MLIPQAIVQQGSGGLTVISDTTLGSPAASIDITSIPGSYRLLWGFGQLRGTKAATSDVLNFTFNNDNSGHYDLQVIFGSQGGTANASSAGQFSATQAADAEIVAANATSGVASPYELVVYNYASTTFWKQGFLRVGAREVTSGPGYFEELYTFNWQDTSAITRVTMTPAGGNLDTGSRFTLFGV